MLINGEKYACEACIRGHRVSNCQHSDRPLQHVNKKGRPVTQCKHCRAQRKTRSGHVKCDCGEKTIKCVHLGATEGHRDTCCCNHGGCCTCALKKELRAVPESPITSPRWTSVNLKNAASATAPALGTSQPPNTGSRLRRDSASKSPVRRRRANTYDDHVRPRLATYNNKKPMLKKNASYQLNHVNSVRSSSGFPAFLLSPSKPANDDEDAGDGYQSSGGNFGSDSGLEDDIIFPSATTAAATSATVVLSGSPANNFLPAQLTPQRRFRSETASPLLFGSSLAAHTCQLPPLNTNNINYSNFTDYSDSAFTSPEPVDQPLFSAGIDPPPNVDWSEIGLALSRELGRTADGAGSSSRGNRGDINSVGKFSRTTDAMSLPTILAGFEFNDSEQAPTMTTATSGEVSETEDFMVPIKSEYDYDCDGTADAASSSVAFSRTSSTYHLQSHSSSNLRTGHSSSNTLATSVSSSTNNGSHDDYRELRFLKASNKFLPTPFTSAPDDLSQVSLDSMMPQTSVDDDDSALWMPECHALPSMCESPESDVISFWGPK